MRRNRDASRASFTTDAAVCNVIVFGAMRFTKAPYWPIPASHDTSQRTKLQNVPSGQVEVAKEMSNIKRPFRLLQFRLSPRRTGFNPRPVCGIRINKMAMGQVPLPVLRFSPVHCSMCLITFQSSLATSSVSPLLPHSSPSKSVPFLRVYVKCLHCSF